MKTNLLLWLLIAISVIEVKSQACDANSTNVELTITSIDITAACAGEPPATDDALEATISINGQILTFSPSGSSDGCVICGGASPVPGNYPVTNADLIDGCSPSTTISLGSAGGSTMVGVTVDVWEEDGGACMYDSGGINADDDFVSLGMVNVDITQPTGSFVAGCYTYNYSIACPAPCEVSACKEVTICISGVDVTEGDGLLGDADPVLVLGGNTYIWDNGVSPGDDGCTPLGNSDGTCTAPAGPACVTISTDQAATNSATLMGVQAWEEDFGCGNSCTADTNCGFFGDNDDNVTGISNIVLTDVSMDGSFMIGDYVWCYEVTSCIQLLELADEGLVVSACDDIGTPDNADDTYTFDLNPIINENIAGSLGANYSISATPGPTPAVTMGNYGAATTFGPLLITDGPQTITVTDASGCISFDVLVVPPAACSGVDCPITPGTWSK